jgi:outer membrane lipoprotein-sorting protein
MNADPNARSGAAAGDDRLARGLAALRNTDVPEGPSEEVLARTLAAIEAASGSRPIIPHSWRKPMFTILKYAAVIAVVAAGWFLVSSPLLVGAPVTFEEVAAKLQRAHTLAYTMTSRLGDSASPQTVRLLFKEPGRLRCETVPASGALVVSDTVAAKKLVLDPSTKTAFLLEGNLPGESRPGQPDLAASEVAGLRQLGQKKGEPVGEKEVGGVKAIGFRVVESPGFERVVWADPRTRLPVEIDISGPYGDKMFHGTIQDIQLDPELDDALFNFEPPKGYAVQKQALVPAGDKDDGSPETAITILLRAYAEKSGGTFPKRLDDWQAYGPALEPKPGEPRQTAAMRAANLVARVAALVFAMQGNYGYRPEGVKLGDADKVILWYRLPGKPTYRAVTGDLKLKDATEDQVPAPLKAPAKP